METLNSTLPDVLDQKDPNFMSILTKKLMINNLWAPGSLINGDGQTLTGGDWDSDPNARKIKYFLYQEIFSRILATNPRTFMFHRPGTGKTFSYLRGIETLRRLDLGLKRAWIIVPASLEITVIEEIRKLGHTGEIGNYKWVSKAKNRTKNIIPGEFYYITSHQGFNEVITLLPDPDQSVYVIDESHHIRATTGESGNFNLYSGFFSGLKESFLVVATGTPFIDSLDSFVPQINLVTENKIDTSFFDSYRNTRIKDPQGASEALMNKLRPVVNGLVSFVREPETEADPSFARNALTDKWPELNLYPCVMGPKQEKEYLKTVPKKLVPEDLVNIDRVQEGAAGSKEVEKSNYAGPERLPDTIEGMKEVGCKIYTLVKDILIQRKKTFIITNRIEYGVEILRKALIKYGYSQVDTMNKLSVEDNMKLVKNSRKGLDRFIVYASSDKSDNDLVKDLFNHPDNEYGDQIMILIGGKTASEGISLNGVINMVFFNTDWNSVFDYQGLRRILRPLSYKAIVHRMEESKNRGVVNSQGRVPVKIYRLAAVTSSGINTIDLRMYRVSLEKDKIIKPVERILKLLAVDCNPLKKINFLPSDKPGSYECDHVDTCGQEVRCDQDLPADEYDTSSITAYGPEYTKYSREQLEWLELQSLKKRDITVDEFDLWFSMKTVELVTRGIKKMLTERGSVKLSDVLDYFPGAREIIVYKAIQKVLEGQVVNMFGQKMTPGIHGDYLYLSNHGYLVPDLYRRSLFVHTAGYLPKFVSDRYNEFKNNFNDPIIRNKYRSFWFIVPKDKFNQLSSLIDSLPKRGRKQANEDVEVAQYNWLKKQPTLDKDWTLDVIDTDWAKTSIPPNSIVFTFIDIINVFDQEDKTTITGLMTKFENGGLKSSGEKAYTTKIEVYNQEEDSWTEITDPNEKVKYQLLIYLDKKKRVENFARGKTIYGFIGPDNEFRIRTPTKLGIICGSEKIEDLIKEMIQVDKLIGDKDPNINKVKISSKVKDKYGTEEEQRYASYYLDMKKEAICDIFRKKLDRNGLVYNYIPGLEE